MLLGCSRLSYCRTPGRTPPADGLSARCAWVSIPRRSSRLATTLPRKLGPSARHVPYVASAWPMRSPLMSGSASGAVLIPGSGTPCAGGWSGVDRPHRQKPGPLRDPGTAAATRQDRGERPLVTPDGPRRAAGRSAHWRRCSAPLGRSSSRHAPAPGRPALRWNAPPACSPSGS
jgi:hypothetical protein